MTLRIRAHPAPPSWRVKEPAVIDRRQFIVASGSLIATAVAVALTRNAGPAEAGASTPAERLDGLFDVFMDERLTRHPERLTSLGLDKGKYAWAKAKLTDESLASVRDDKANQAAQLERLKAFDRNSVSGRDRADYDTVMFQLETQARLAPFDYGSGVRPYVVSQLTGSYQSVPNFLDRQHQVKTREDADDYLARLRAFAQVLDEETERVRHDAGLKVVPPDFILDRTLEQMQVLRSASPADTILTTSLATRTQKAGIAGNWGTDAQKIVAQEVYPALDRQRDALRALRAHAAHSAGVGHLPEGHELYQVALREGTTTEMTSEEVHQLGLTQARELTARMDAILKAEGRTSGTVAERAQALARDPKYLYPDTDAGRQQILDYCNGLIKALQPHLPKYFRIMPKTPVEVRRVPVYTQAGAPGGYYQTPSLDGSRPGAFYINLRDTHEWSRWKLPTLVYHESEPGHHFQLALVLEMPKLPLIRKSGGTFAGNVEGWAVYAETLVDEMGMYDSEPLGRLGMLQSMLFRAARCVVDTGIHVKGWNRERAINYLVETTGDNRSAMTSEVERYCVWPGQATSYKVGQTRWLALREDARRRLGTKFDIRDFHDVGLTAAPMPMSVLATVMDEWVKSRLSGPA
jgi:uncharacterized protein (DUF885 family)